MLGREVKVLVDEDAAAGVYRARVGADGLASGVYLYRLNVRPGNAGGAPGSPGSGSAGSGSAGSGSVGSEYSLTKRLVLIK